MAFLSSPEFVRLIDPYRWRAQLIPRHVIYFKLLKHASTESAKWIKQTRIKALFPCNNDILYRA